MRLNLKGALEARRLAEREVALQLALAYPVESWIEWSVGEHRQCGKVVRLSGDRVQVRNQVSGRESWIYADRIL